jgi:putative nucleotidyltransferase with HDIG domain
MTRILVIDDDAVIRDLMTEILEGAGHEIVAAATGAEAAGRLTDADIDLVVSDIVMPDLSGLELLEAVRLHRPSLPVVLVTGADTYENLTEALTRGADGLVSKPFTHAALRDAIGKALERAGRSEQELRERLLAPTLTGALANAIEAREGGMRGHCDRLAALAMRLASACGVEQQHVETIRLGALLHDIGKIGVPDRVLLKEGPLSSEEFEAMQRHTVIGDDLLAPLDLLADVRPIVRSHHERWDGGGYPDGLTGEEIPLGARILAVADSVEAMSAQRVYRDPLPEPQIVRELEQGRGVQWDPAIVDLALGMIDSGELSFAADGLRIEYRSPVGPGKNATVFEFPVRRNDSTARSTESAG